MNERERYQRGREVFVAIYDLPPERRREKLHEACGEQPSLCREVEELFAEMDAVTSLFADSRDFPAALGLDSRAKEAPDGIGRYRILGEIGRGGMGVVYRAEQESPHRVVALKVIRPELATPGMLRRFRREAEALGTLQHPCIAQVYEASPGDESGQIPPFIAMELVEGLSLTAYAREQKLELRDRIQLLIQICRAVQHAHQKGVIHRDLKPGNVLVDGDGRPKVLDFGIAKMLSSEAVGAKRDTATALPLGTLPYMSPEQCGGEPDVDTRSDVHALGVMGFELLTGALPYEIGPQLDWFQAARVIRDHQPRRAGEVDRRLRGDLEVILAKALEKDREQRYATAAELAADLERYLRKQPILARRPSFLYALGKLAARNKLLAFGLALFLLGGLLFIRGILQGAAADRRTASVLDDVHNALVVANASLPYVLPGEPGDQAREEFAASFGAALEGIERRYEIDQPEMARALDTVGLVLLAFGEHERAVETLSKALDLERANRDPDDPKTLVSMHNLAMALALAGREAEAEDLYRKTIEGRSRVLGDDDLETAATRFNLGLLLQRNERWAEAEAVFRSVHASRVAALGERDPVTVRAEGELAIALSSLGRTDEAVEVGRRVLDARMELLGASNPETLTACINLAENLSEVGAWEEARAQAEIVLTTLHDSQDPDPETAARALWTLGSAMHRAGNFEAAEPAYRDALALFRWTSGTSHPYTLAVRMNLASLVTESGRPAEAIPLLLELARSYDATGEPSSAEALRVKHNLGQAYHEAKRFEEARAIFEEVLDGRRTLLPEGHPETLSTLVGLGSALTELGEYDDALAIYNDALESDEYRQNWTRFDVLVTRYNVAELEMRRGRIDVALALFRDLLADAGEGLKPDHWFVGVFRTGYGRCLVQSGAFAEAETQLTEARRILEPRGATDLHWQEALQGLIELYTASGEGGEAEQLRSLLGASAQR